MMHAMSLSKMALGILKLKFQNDDKYLSSQVFEMGLNSKSPLILMFCDANMCSGEGG